MIDLHTHSTASDGQYSPSQLIEKAAKNGIHTIALTDHDTTFGLKEAAETAKKYQIQFINGIELDTKYPGISGNFHILGYGFQAEHPALASSCSNLAEQRLERANRIFSYLEEYGIQLEHEKVFSYAGGSVIARPHFARAMHEAGYVSSTQEAFDLYLDTEAFQKIDRPKPHPKVAIEMILNAGGLPVLAHPSQLKLGDHSISTLLMELKSYGLAGLECYYSTYTKEETEHFLSLAKQMDLYITGGSDFHGEKVKASIALGTGIDFNLHVKTTLPLITL